MSRIAQRLFALLLLLLAQPTMGGVVDSPLPTPFTQHVFTVPGLVSIGLMSAYFSCTNLDKAPVTIGVELFGSNGGVENDASTEALTLGPGETRLWGTSGAINMAIDSLVSGFTSSKNSARILSTSTKIGCYAFLADPANGPPTSGWPLTIIAKTKQKAAN